MSRRITRLALMWQRQFLHHCRYQRHPTAPSSTAAGGNGVYAYGGTNTAGIFPTNTFNAANYWADVVFTASTGGGTNNPPVAVNDSGFTATAQNTALNIPSIGAARQ